MVTERLDIDAGHDDPEKAWDEDHIHHQNLDPEEADNEYGEQFSLEQAFLYEDELEFDRIQDKETYSSHINLGNVPIVKITTSSNEDKNDRTPTRYGLCIQRESFKRLIIGGICMHG